MIATSVSPPFLSKFWSSVAHRGGHKQVSLLAAMSVCVASLCSACGSPAASQTPPKASAEGTSATESKQPAAEQDPGARAASVFVVHQVEDFDAYLKQFEGNAGARADAGVTRVILVRLSDKQRVGLHFQAGSLASVKEFLAGTEYEQLVQADQATESTLLWIATDELDELPSVIPKDSASLFKKFAVDDVACVLQGMTAKQAELEGQGLLGFSVHTSESNAKMVLLHLVAGDEAAALRVYSGDTLAPLLSRCGATKLDNPVVGINQSGT